MRLYLIRHGKTAGNLQKRYIGSRTDEPLCEEGIRELRQLAARRSLSIPIQKSAGGETYSETSIVPDRVIVSPLLRCRQTADLLFPGYPQQIEMGLRECDFGSFENKNYQELRDDPRYQAWVDSGGTLPFPDGESPEMFRERCREAFHRVETQLTREKCRCAALVVHGGTIMSIMEAVAKPKGSYFDFQVKNASGYLLEGDRGVYSYKPWPGKARRNPISEGSNPI